jgi:antitoxin ParD1/3/4
MNITLTPQLEELIQSKVDSGRYSDASDVVIQALQVLERAEQLERLRAEIQIGLDQIERGETIEWTEDTMDRLIREAEENSRLGKPISDFVKP